MILIQTTCKDEEEARRIGLELLEKQLVACVNWYPVKSRYWWKGTIEMGVEVMLAAKSRSALCEKVIKTIQDIHSYDTPTIEVIDAKTTEETNKWIEESTKDELK